MPKRTHIIQVDHLAQQQQFQEPHPIVELKNTWESWPCHVHGRGETSFDMTLLHVYVSDSTEGKSVTDGRLRHRQPLKTIAMMSFVDLWRSYGRKLVGNFNFGTKSRGGRPRGWRDGHSRATAPRYNLRHEMTSGDISIDQNNRNKPLVSSNLSAEL